MGFLDKFKSKISSSTSTSHSVPSKVNTTQTEEGTKYVPKTYRTQDVNASADKGVPAAAATTNNTVPGTAENGVDNAHRA